MRWPVAYPFASTNSIPTRRPGREPWPILPLTMYAEAGTK